MIVNPSLLIAFGFAVVIAYLYIRVPIRIALIGLLVVTFGVPGTVHVPHLPTNYATYHRVLLALFCVNVLWKIRRGRLPLSVLRPSRLVYLLLVWVIATFIVGVAFADTSINIGSTTFLWSFAVEQLVFVVFVIAAFRAIDDTRQIVWILAVFAVAMAGIAIGEHFTKRSFGVYTTRLLTGQIYSSKFHHLSARGGAVRVSAGADFSLAFAWVQTVLFPVVMAAAAMAKQRLLRFAPAALLVAIVFTSTRSVYVGLPFAAAVMLVAAKFDVRLLRMMIAGVVLVAFGLLLTGTLQRAFHSTGTKSSTLVREDRLPIILSSAADRPLTGNGLASLSVQGIRTTDATYLLVYGELGILGAAALIVLFGGTLTAMLPALRGPPDERLAGAAALAGVVAGLVGAAFLDEFSKSGSFRAFWLVACLGAVIAERHRPEPAVQPVGARPWRRRVVLLVALPAAGAGLGLLITALTPTSLAPTLRFVTRSPRNEARLTQVSDYVARANVTMACSIIEARVLADPGDRVNCYDDLTKTGVADLRIEAPSQSRIDRRLRTVALVVHRFLPGFRLFAVTTPVESKPTGLRTAPYWLAFLGLGIAAFVSGRPVRERVRIMGFFGNQVWPAPGV